MRVLCAPVSYKGTLSAADAAAAMARGVRAAMPNAEVDVCPVADGGEGTLHTLLAAWHGEQRHATVTGPLGTPVTAAWGLFPDRQLAVVELAQAAGLMLVPEQQRDPLRTTTHGAGELIRHAAATAGVDRIVVGLGGSATVDGGTGIAQALGMRFIDGDGLVMTQPMCGALLQRIARIDTEAVIDLPALEIACDVDHPLTGTRGAAAVFGPQKGATPDQVWELEAGLHHLADVLGDAGEHPGDGSAGGAGYGLRIMCGATLRPGIDLVLDAVDFTRRCRDVDLVLTGEGRLDTQSLGGKACIGVARAAAALGVPVTAIVGSASTDGTAESIGQAFPMFRSVLSLADLIGMEDAMADPANAITAVVWTAMTRPDSQP